MKELELIKTLRVLFVKMSTIDKRSLETALILLEKIISEVNMFINNPKLTNFESVIFEIENISADILQLKLKEPSLERLHDKILGYVRMIENEDRNFSNRAMTRILGDILKNIESTKMTIEDLLR